MHGRWVLSYPITNVHANVCSQKHLDIDKRHALQCDIFHIIITVLYSKCLHTYLSAYEYYIIMYVQKCTHVAIHKSYVVV